MQTLDRLLRPKTVAVIGGGAWCANVIRECLRIGFKGEIWPVHPGKAELGGLAAFAALGDLPAAPDAVFIGVNRLATVDLVAELSAMGAGGAVCFASGFREAKAELQDGDSLQDRLLEAAGNMPILGPNCYGFINALDGAALWPDQHGAVAVESGVAIVTQSSNIAINLTMQRRGLPLAYIVTAGNQAQRGLAAIGAALLDDTRVTALGLHIEGVGDVRDLEALASRARSLGKSIVALKVGASRQAQAATVSHTASIAGSDAGARALLDRLGIGRVRSLSAMLETLKILHAIGPLASNRIASVSCSGGEASLMADSALAHDLDFPALNDTQEADLRAALGPQVALANPLDYHTYIWGDLTAMTAAFAGIMDPCLALGCIVLDFPREDRCDASDWHLVIDAVTSARDARGVPMAILSSLPETLPEAVAETAIGRGLVPLMGIAESLEAISVAASLGRAVSDPVPVLLAPGPAEARTLSEVQAKARLSAFGLRCPDGRVVSSADAAGEAAEALGFPVVLKGEGAAHKSDAGLVALGLTDRNSVEACAREMDAPGYLVETMVRGGLAEILVGITADPAHGFVLTLGAGGTLTEVMCDSVSLMVPATADEIAGALHGLRIAPLLAGYRGAPAVDQSALVEAVLAVQSYVEANAAHVIEVEVNPLICTAVSAIAADALIRTGETT